MSGKQLHHLLQINSGAVYWIKVNQHNLIIMSMPAGSTLHYTLLAPKCNSRLFFCPGEEAYPWVSRTRETCLTFQELEASACQKTSNKSWLAMASSSVNLVSWLTSLDCFLSYGADVVYQAYGMQEFQNQESYRSVKIYKYLYFGKKSFK